MTVARGSTPTLEGWLRQCQAQPRLWLTLLAALLALQISPWWYATPDATIYLSMARSLVRGHSITRLGSQQLGFPPGYPLLISPVFLVADHPFLLLSILHWGLAVALMLGVYRWARRQCPAAALLLTALVMVNVSLWIHYRRPLSELAFMTVMIWAVNLLNAALATSLLRRALAGSVLLLLLGMIREVGVAFVAGFVTAAIVAAYRGRLRYATAIAIGLIAAAPATIAVVGFARYDVAMAQRSADQGGTHLDALIHPPSTFASTTARTSLLAEGLRLRVSEVGRLLVPGMFKAYGKQTTWRDPHLALYAPLFILIAIGWWRLVHGSLDTLALTAPFYVGAYVAWPFAADTRYLLPLLPVLVASLWCLLELLPVRRLELLAVLLVAHLGVALGYWLAIDGPRARVCNAEWSSVERLATQIPPAANGVAARTPECVRLMLAFVLDRPVRDLHNAAPVDRNVQWIVVPDADVADAGFRPHARAGTYTLLTREGGQ